jgi:small subunit ribosomal protein S6
MRPYELMLIFDSVLEEGDFQAQVTRFREQVDSRGGRVAKTDVWGRRRFAYEIDHKVEGYYVVFELLLDAAAVEAFDRQFRLADEVVRHKFIRLPDHEAAKRGLGTDQAEAAPAS